MYYPTHRPQLTGIATEIYDCGVRATQMAIDWLSKGAVSRSVKAIRKAMGDQDATNYEQWDRVIDELGGQTLGFSGERTNEWERVADHMKDGGAVILAVDYGIYRRSMQSKSGHLTFDGFHAILFVGQRTVRKQTQWRSFDALLDGRYKGCPNGPVWVPRSKVKKASLAVGVEVASTQKVYALLLHRDDDIDPIDPGDLLPAGGLTLGDILSDLNDTLATTTEPDVRTQLTAVIDGLEALIGIVGNPEADATTPVDSGISIA